MSLNHGFSKIGDIFSGVFNDIYRADHGKEGDGFLSVQTFHGRFWAPKAVRRMEKGFEKAVIKKVIYFKRR